MNTRAIAEQLVGARRRAEALAAFPGESPPTLDAAYEIQDCAIDLWGDRVAGWKVGRIDTQWSERLGEDRLVGPIFSAAVRNAVPVAAADARAASSAEAVEFPVFAGGFAAVEAEFVFRLLTDAPPAKLTWTAAEAAELPATLTAGIETAGSPIAAINDHGPLVVVGDFGNNAGLLLGPEISAWRERPPAALTCETFIDGRSAGRGGALSLPGGPLAALAFALQRCARRGRPLVAGDLVSSGATTGIHEIRSGQQARVRFDGIAELACRAVPAVARSGGAAGTI
jgi:2-keto-4-pentenoate hydratase